MKSYRNLYIIGAIVVFLIVFGLYRTVSFEDILYKVGVYDDKITIAVTSDVHGHIIYEDNSWGQYTSEDIYGVMGLPTVKGLFNEIQKKNKNSLILDCGDMFHGTNEALIDDGEGIVQIANKMGYTAGALGSNDFNFGYERLLQIRDELKYPILCANIYVDNERLFEPYQLVTVGDKTIGLMGLTNPEVYKTAVLRDVEGFTTTDPVEEAKKMVQELRDKADVVVLLSYLGDNKDTELIKQVDGIDLVLSARRHNLYTRAVKVNDTYIAEAGAWTTHLGITNIYMKDNKVKKITWKVKSTKKKSYADQDMTEIADKYHTKALAYAEEVLGNTKVELDGKRINIRTSETNFGDLLADAMKAEGEADIAIVNGGAIRESIEAGEVNMYQIQKALPFANALMTIEASGKTIRQALERGVKKYPDAKNGAFLQVSGLTYTINASENAGSRIEEVYVGEELLQDEKMYKLAISDYLYYGGDDYEEFEACEIIDTSNLLSDVLASYIKDKKEISSVEGGRINVVKKRY